MDKKALRKEIRIKKSLLSREQIMDASLQLAEMFFHTEMYKRAKTIYGYMPYNQEVRTEIILQQALKDGKRIAVPKVYGDKMRCIYIEDFLGLEESEMGIPEPIADSPIAADEYALVIMPGLAFDPKGHRIGYGGGYYDRFLAIETNHPTIALCYDFQMYPELDTDAFDIPVDQVLWVEI